MNISYNWLKDLIETDLSPTDLARKLTSVGLAVEGIHKAAGDDFVFDIDLTSNRPDCLSHLGVAREVRAITNYELRITNEEAQIPQSAIGNPQLVVIEDADLCHRFTARIIRNVKIQPSPEWLVKRLEAVGERSINNVADITNYVMHELGQPMHSFDFNKLKGNRIVVRRARGGETIKTLDEVERKLDESVLAICDAENPVAVAGVMGGFDSGITPETTDVLLEVAYFKRENIRQTSRKLGLATEASYHFERGVDIENLIRASTRATALICELAGGEAGEFVDVYPTRAAPNEIESRDISRAVKRLTGLDVEEAEILRILSALGIERKNSALSTQHSALFIAPSWRHDIAIEEDLVEEVARIVGYDKIGDALPPSQSAGEYQPTEPRKKSLRRALANLGFDEAICYSFIDTRFDETFALIDHLTDENAEEKFVTLQDSIIEGAVRMRPSLLSGLLDAVRTNFHHQQRNVRLFELGKVFAATANEDSLPKEQELFALALSGGEMLEGKATPARELDFYDAKGALETAIDAINLPALEFAAKDVKHLRRGQSAEIRFGGKPVGTIGRLNDEIAAAYKFRQPVFVAEIDLQTLLQAKQKDVSYRPLSIYPAILRDVSLHAGRSVSFARIKQTVEAQGFELLRKVEFVDVYETGIKDERSITIRLEYRSDERTLTEAEAEAVHTRILQILERDLGAKQRIYQANVVEE
ncbi:MAG TPA: phenylalanine--tRNA ligase subunit beta [Pyrinomonadaceae bacterium]|nr:phenylalanine--tRNA ligase subunit beta [Pyrinomonadaceae bacterium]